MNPTREVQRKRLLVTGQVQGVGFRPFVYRLATEMNLTGWVLNDPGGVTIEIQGDPPAASGFAKRLRNELPPLASIHTCREAPAAVMVGEKRFEIRPSEGGELTDAQITVDTATCADCLRELSDPADPRYRYPFINCTNCGPRYTIVRRIPYDRPNTTMDEFELCPFCAGQYSDPADRRFHAQPVACPACGPHVWLAGPEGDVIECDDPIAAAAEMLKAGRIVAIKGLGGFHLACRADDAAAVDRLRDRKRRDAKPFALMVRDLAVAKRLCEVADEAEALLTGPLRPIVLLPKADAADEMVASSVAGGLNSLGIMLPYTPVHHLLFAAIDRPLVMTSANYSDEPLVKDNDEAVDRLGRLADALLLHNRRIERRLDDSVVQLTGTGRLSVLRRARGFAPQPVRMTVGGAPGSRGEDGVSRSRKRLTPQSATDSSAIRSPQSETDDSAGENSAIRNPQSAIGRSAIGGVLAVGAELKSAVCLYRDGRAVLGEHIGDLKDGRTYRQFMETIAHLEELFEIAPDAIAADLHPQYLSSEYALRRHRGELPNRPPARLIRVQHHHAHAAACLAENGRSGPAIGLICDGVGYGDDGTVWGCEVLRADLLGYERMGRLRPIPLPGGDRAAIETYRPAVAAMVDALGEGALAHPAVRRLGVEQAALAETAELLQLSVSSPLSSSLGRWFDAVAGLCGVAAANRFEGQAPMLLESALTAGVEGAYEFRIESEGPFEIDLRPMVVQLADALAGGAAVGEVSAKFHNTVAAMLAAAAIRAREATGLSTVALSGGCFANRYLTGRLVRQLESAKFDVLTHRNVPTNDGGVALGQAMVAAARIHAGM